jgi:hypothetical protein
MFVGVHDIVELFQPITILAKLVLAGNPDVVEKASNAVDLDLFRMSQVLREIREDRPKRNEVVCGVSN